MRDRWLRACGYWNRSHEGSYDLAGDADLRVFYVTVIRETMHIEDVRTLLNGRFLADLWPRLWFSPQVRGAWKSRLPDLVSAAA
ncbi:hypothetical protein GCM10017557_24270 [Streptomyces aurantiacus]|uniref:Uncharacterized protein n=1 Tax=Streptomyces aurantiacus TaxID=47760 RepID=A0A7G1NWR0_9ACTN|nr:hypothetical protein GCM10017557_24270 [Streptomyces aurantiacus]